MTRKNGGVEETCQHMEYAKMITKRIAIEGEWYTLQTFKEGDGTLRLELVHNVTGKYYKMYPDNFIKESEDG